MSFVPHFGMRPKILSVIIERNSIGHIQLQKTLPIKKARVTGTTIPTKEGI